MELAQTILGGNTVVIEVQGISIELKSENLLVTMQGLEGYAFAGEGEMGVVLETHISEELREEGNLREIISKIQNMRKESGFEVSDKINLYVHENQMLESIVKKFSDFIMKETLAVNIIYGEKKEYIECIINGEKFNIALEISK